MKIEPSEGPVKLDKRTNLPFILKDICPGCGAAFKADLSTSHYLSYPKVNAEFDFGCYCNECDQEWDRRLSLNVSLVLAVEFKDGYPAAPIPDGACGLCGSFTCNGRCFK